MMRRGIGFWAHPEFMKFMVSSVVVIGCLVCPLESFASNGVLITAFTNPVPTSFANFGSSLAAVGSDWVVIGAPGDDTGAENAGAAYLFATNGAILMRFTNPIPKTGASFGETVTVMGTNCVLIGACLS